MAASGTAEREFVHDRSKRMNGEVRRSIISAAGPNSSKCSGRLVLVYQDNNPTRVAKAAMELFSVKQPCLLKTQHQSIQHLTDTKSLTYYFTACT